MFVSVCSTVSFRASPFSFVRNGMSVRSEGEVVYMILASDRDFYFYDSDSVVAIAKLCIFRMFRLCSQILAVDRSTGATAKCNVTGVRCSTS